ncbi:MAG TPA: hypothetical protein VH500_04630 [Nitrososphaeraceae archaeon]|jgi:hypothetical protein
MTGQLVNREVGRLIAQTNGVITTVLDRDLVLILIPSVQPNLDGFVHVQITRATMPSASMYMQLNFIVAKARHLSLLNQAADLNYHFPITNKQSINLPNLIQLS